MVKPEHPFLHGWAPKAQRDWVICTFLMLGTPGAREGPAAYKSSRHHGGREWGLGFKSESPGHIPRD